MQAAGNATKQQKPRQTDIEASLDKSVAMMDQVRMKNRSGLHRLHLIEYEQNLTPHVMKTLKKRLQYAKRSCLNGALENCFGITEENMKFFGHPFKKEKFLRSLNLKFGSYRQKSDCGLLFLSEGLRSLSNLKCLSLNFPHCFRITNKEFESLFKSLRSLSSLVSLTLSFRFCREITDRELESLAKSFKFLSSLQNLNLSFSLIIPITDKGIKSLSKSFRSFSALKSLHLNLNNCSNITDQFLKYLSQSFRFLVSLQNLTLCFSNTQVTDYGVEYLAEGIRSLSSLKSVTINLAWCNQISTQAKLALKQDSRTIKSIRNIIINNKSV